jgi:uncharacterized protein
MADKDDAAPSPEGSAPEMAGVARRRPRALVVAYAALFMSLAASVIAVDMLGPAAVVSPVVSVKLPAFSGVGEDGAPPPASARGRREAGGHPIADPGLIEDTLQGPLPQIATDGRTPLALYAGRYDRADTRPRIAVIVRGLGVGIAGTTLALQRLPPAVTLAFTPFVADLQFRIDGARGKGHEVLIEVPMEPFDFPDSDPGPHMLLAAAGPEEIIRQLEWSLSRATGYAGIMNLLGGRFMGNEGAMETVLDQVARRGLMFFDNGASASSLRRSSASER